MRSRFCLVIQYNKKRPGKYRVNFFILAASQDYFICHLETSEDFLLCHVTFV